MHTVAAWFIGASYISYRYGYKCKMLPLPKRYIALTGFISIAALISLANETAGGLIAYGSLLAMFLYGQQNPDKAPCDTLKSTSTAGGQSSGAPGNPNGPSGGNVPQPMPSVGA